MIRSARPRPLTRATRRAVLGLAVTLLVATVSLGLLISTLRSPVDGPTRTVRVDLVDAAGLRVGDDVRLAGVRVGTVRGLRLGGGLAHVDLDVRRDAAITTTTGAVLRYQDLIGQRYLALTPGRRAGAPLADGATIPTSRTSPGFDLTALLDGFRPLFEVLSPEDVNALSISLIKVLQGEGGTIAGLLQETTRLTGFLADQDELLHRTAQRLTPVLSSVASDGTALQDTVGRLARLTTALARHRAEYASSIDGLAGSVAHLDALTARAQAPLARDVLRLQQVARLYAAHSDDYARATPELARLLASLGRATSYRSALTTYMCRISLAAGPLVAPLALPSTTTSQVCR